jgi:hypothetical protein
MSSLSMLEKSKLEKLFGMSSGYVLNFSDRTFADFFAEQGNIDIHADKYCGGGTSKANKLRAFWKLDSDHIVGATIQSMINHYLSYSENGDKKAVEECKAIATRLLSGSLSLDGLKDHEAVFNSVYIGKQIKRMEDAVNDDPALAIGTAKELIETCCKTILAEHHITVSSTDDIPKLTKATLKVLNLVPEDVNEASRGADVIKRLLSNLGTIGNGIAELRGLYGTGHGKHASVNGLKPRHAKLAVGAAATLVMFLFDTHMEGKR